MTSATERSRPPLGAIPSTMSENVCIDFVNSRFTDHTGAGDVYDRLGLLRWQRWFAERCGLSPLPPPRPQVHQELAALRDLLRRLLDSRQPPGAQDVVRLNGYLSRTTQWQEIAVGRGPSGVRLTVRWSDPGWPAVITTVASAYARLIEDLGSQRVRDCANPDCSFLFVDTSRNGSRLWCDVAVCGNLIKVRRHRARTRLDSN